MNNYSNNKQRELPSNEEIAIRIYITAQHLGIKPEIVWKDYLSDEIKSNYKKKEIMLLISELL